MLVLRASQGGGFDAYSVTGQYRGWAPTKQKAKVLAHRSVIPVSRATPISKTGGFGEVRFGWLFKGRAVYERGPVGCVGIGEGLFLDMHDGTVFKYGPAERTVVEV